MSLAEDLIEDVEKKFSQTEQVLLRNCSDKDFDTSLGYVNQFIIGLTQAEIGGSIDKYLAGMTGKLGAIFPGTHRVTKAGRIQPLIKWFSRPFEGTQDELKSVLHTLSKHFKVELDIKRMERDFTSHSSKYHIVIFIVEVPFIVGNLDIPV